MDEPKLRKLEELTAVLNNVFASLSAILIPMETNVLEIESAEHIRSALCLLRPLLSYFKDNDVTPRLYRVINRWKWRQSVLPRLPDHCIPGHFDQGHSNTILAFESNSPLPSTASTLIDDEPASGLLDIPLAEQKRVQSSHYHYTTRSPAVTAKTVSSESTQLIDQTLIYNRSDPTRDNKERLMD